MKLASLLFLVLAAAACTGANGSSTGAPPTAEPSGAAPITRPPPSDLTADGKHFAAERIYEGNCAPAGSRGGCYTLTLRPDGTMSYFMLDAGVEGTYEIREDIVVITPTGGNVQPFPLSSDHSRAGDLGLKQ